MTKAEALRIVEIYGYHNQKAAEAYRANDTEAIQIHERVLQLIQSDYQKANKVLQKFFK